MKKISVIIPVYNTEKYILRCLNSLKNQSYKNLEICIVNDCSTDNSHLVINEFIKKNPQLNINYIVHDINKGSAGARISALKSATGEFIHMLDADDYILPDTYKNAFEKIESENCDVCMWGWTELTEDNKTLFNYSDKYNYFSGVLSGDEVLKRKMLRWLWICMGNALYSSAVVKASSPVFFEGLDMGEDFYFICKTLLNSQRVCCVAQENFKCVARSSSMTHTLFNEKSTHPFLLFSLLRKVIESYEGLSTQNKEILENILDVEVRRTYIANVNLACRTFNSIEDILLNIKKVPYNHTRLDKKYSHMLINKINRIEYRIFRASPHFYCLIYRCKYILAPIMFNGIFRRTQ